MLARPSANIAGSQTTRFIGTSSTLGAAAPKVERRGRNPQMKTSLEYAPAAAPSAGKPGRAAVNGACQRSFDCQRVGQCPVNLPY